MQSSSFGVAELLIVRGTPVISHVPLLFPIFPVSFWCVPPPPDLIPEYFLETQKLRNAPEVVRSIPEFPGFREILQNEGVHTGRTQGI